ncbi:MAG: hypothetical protein IT430_16590 [Phycisphaerales bacterium]|nr:hypothetical protein [Phycisphaerales bacterium]
MSSPPPVHVIIPTHTDRYLDFVLVGLARQTVAPASITVTCDVVDERIDQMISRCADWLGLSIRHVRRAHTGAERLAQVRNNAVRALIDAGVTSGSLLFLDGDTYPSDTCIAQHARLGEGVDLVLPHRIYLSDQQTAALDAGALLRGEQVIQPKAEQLAELARLHRRYMVHQRLRRVRLTKSHKPKMLGGHHSVTLEMFRRVNGHDEQYHTWGTEDDDFCRRVYQAGGSGRVAVRDILVYHLHHPTRAPGEWSDRANARRFLRRDLPMRCEHGLESPLDQPPVQVDLVAPAVASGRG